MTAAALLVVFPFAMAYAAFSDLVSMTIQNRVSLTLAGGFLVVALLLGFSWETLAAHYAVGLLCLVVTFGMFAAGWMGGGDAKLLAATAIWFGPSIEVFHYFLTASIYGGILTLALLLARVGMAPATGIDFVDHLLRKETGIPYGIALGAAGLTTYSSGFWIETALARLG